MAFLSIEVDEKTLNDVKFMLDTVKNGAEKAIIRAANQTAVTARSRVVKTTNERLYLTQKRIREETRVTKTNTVKVGASVHISRKALPLVDFPHITSFVGLSVTVRRARAAEFYRHRFVARMPSGHVGIFERRFSSKTGKPAGRLKIDEVPGPSIGMVFHSNDEKKLFDEMMILFQERVIARAEFLLSKA